MKSDRNIFINDYLGLEITKPEHWEFMPATWLDNAKNATINSKSFFEDKKVNPAVFAMVYRPSAALEFYPTVQCRLSYNDGKQYSELKPEMKSSLEELFSEVKIIEDTDDYVISGKRCSSTKVQLAFEDIFGNRYEFKSQQLVITYPHYFLMISFSSVIDSEASIESDFLNILRSIKLKY